MAEADKKLKTFPFQRLFSVRRVARILTCSDRLVYHLVKQGRIEAYRIGKNGIRIPEESVLKYLEANRVDPEADCSLEN